MLLALQAVGPLVYTYLVTDTVFFWGGGGDIRMIATSRDLT